MLREEAYEVLNEVFRDVFDDESILVTDETTSEDIDDWDSLEHINLMVAIENKFNIKFNMGEITSFQNVGELMDSILSKVK